MGIIKKFRVKHLSLAQWLFLALLGVAAAVNLFILIVKFNYRWDTTIPEDSIVYSIMALVKGRYALYRDYTVFPYATTPYGPLYYIVSAILTKIAGGTIAAAYLAGRAVTCAFFFVSLILVYKIARTLDVSRLAAWVSVLVAMALPMLNPWEISCRPDFMAIAFSLGGMYLLCRSEQESALPSALCWLLGWLTKPSFVTGPIGWCIHLFTAHQDRRLIRFVLLYSIASGVLLFIVQWASHGEYIQNVFLANITPMCFAGLKRMWEDKMLIAGDAVIAAGLFSGLYYCWQERKITRIFVFACSSTLLFILFALKAGAAENYFFEFLFLWASLIAVGFEQAVKWSKRYVLFDLVLVAALIGVVVWQYPFHDIRNNLKGSYYTADQDTLDQLIKFTPGEILFISNGEGMRAHAGVTLLDAYNDSYLEDAHGIDVSPLVQRIRNREFSAVVMMDYQNYYGYTVVPKTMLKALNDNYVKVLTLPPYCFMVVKPPENQ